MTANQLRQVLRTYTTQWMCWVAVVYWLLLHAPLLGRPWPSVPSSERLLNITVGPLTGDFLLGVLLGTMLKLQFANPRARLLPSFAVSHLAVAGAIVGVALAIETVLAFSLELHAQLVLFSLSLVAIAFAAWTAYLRSSIYVLFFLALIFANVFARQYVVALIEALIDNPIASLGIACVGLAAMAALGARLWALSEEMPEYYRQISGGLDFNSRAGNRKWRRWEAQTIARSGIQGWLRDVQFRLVLRSSTAMGPLRRLLLRQLAGGLSGLSVMTPVFVVMVVLLMFQSLQQKPFHAGSVFLPSLLPLVMVLSMLGGIWLRQWPFLARESLWPLGRRDFVRGYARSMACDMTGAAGMHCAMLIVWLTYSSPQGSSPELLPRWLALTMAQYVVAYCLMFWLVSFRSFWALILGIVAGSGISAGLVTAALFADEGLWSLANVAAAIIVTALGVALLYRLAFRRWCHVDLD